MGYFIIVQGRNCFLETVDRKYLEKRIESDKAELERLREKERNDQTAEKLHSIYQSLVDKGFTEEQAFYIFYEAVKAAWGNV